MWVGTSHGAVSVAAGTKCMIIQTFPLGEQSVTDFLRNEDLLAHYPASFAAETGNSKVDASRRICCPWYPSVPMS